MPDWPGPYRESKRKTDQYMPAEARLDDHTFLVCAYHEPEEEWYIPSGENAFKESLDCALRGIHHLNQTSCLRGTLRKAVIQLAEDIRVSDAQPDEAERVRTRIAALEQFLAFLDGYRVVPEQSGGQIVWRRKLL
jgi:hypothetical protein